MIDGSFAGLFRHRWLGFPIVTGTNAADKDAAGQKALLLAAAGMAAALWFLLLPGRSGAG